MGSTPKGRRAAGVSSRAPVPHVRPARSLITSWLNDRDGVRRDRLTWVAYVMLAWFADLQAAPGLVIVHLRDELDLSYSAGRVARRGVRGGEHGRGRRRRAARAHARAARLFWLAAVLMGAGRSG